MEGLSLDNILTGSDIENLFTDQEIQESEPEKTEDNSTEDFDLTSSIENLYTAHFNCQFTPTKNVKLIKMHHR